MTDRTRLPPDARRDLARPLAATRAGMVAERVARGFWPFWTLALLIVAALMFGVQDHLPLAVSRAAALLAAGAAGWSLWHGWRGFRWPSEADALDRLDRTMPGRPITALSDSQAIGATDPASRAVWEAHVARMAERVRKARAVSPDLRIAARDPFALRYAALLAFVVALLFGSVFRIATVTGLGSVPGSALAAGPAWEGWVEPPAHTGRPSLYLLDIPEGTLEVPEGSRMTLRLYGEVGQLDVTETVSGPAPMPATEGTAVTDAQGRSFVVAQSGEVSVDGPGGRAWTVTATPDKAPRVEVTAAMERTATGEFRQPFSASDDYGVTAGQATIRLDLAAVDRRFGLLTEPDPQDPIVVDLPMPITGGRDSFDEVLIGEFSRHPWANLPVTIEFEVADAVGQTGTAAPLRTELAGLRFFDPLAKAIIEQRRDLLWSRANAPRVAQVLRAVSWRPADIFSSDTLYLRLRVAIRRLEAGFAVGPLEAERQEEIAEVLWEIAERLEFGDMADALERLRRAQDRLSEAMKDGASDAEIAELMQELREAMNDYMRQLAEQSQQQDQQQAQQDMQEITGDQLQEMMDRIQELMEEGRMDEAQRLLDELSRMMENMQVTQGQQGQGQPSPGQQAMEGLQETLRDQQGLSDEAFRDLQEQYNPGSQSGESQQNQGRNGDQGSGQSHEGQQGQEGQQGGGQEGAPGQSLADRQQALRDELERQSRNLPGSGTPEGDAARDALGRAESEMSGAEDALRDGDIPEALDRQSDAMEALREGMRNLGEAMAQEQQQQQQNGQGQAASQGDPQGRQRDPLGREPGAQGQLGTDEQLLQGEEVQRRAEELLDEIRRRSGEQARPEQERDYLKRLLDRF